MPEETSEAPVAQETEVHPDQQELLDLEAALEERTVTLAKERAEAEIDPVVKEDPPAEDTQAEVVTAPDEGGETDEAAKPDGAAVEEETEPKFDLKGLPDEDADRLLRAHEKGVLDADDIAAWKTRLLKGDGFDKKARELAEERKALQAKAERGEEFDRMFEDEAARDRYLAFLEQEKSKTEPAEVPESFDSDKELVEYTRKMVQEELERAEKARAAEIDRAREVTKRMSLDAIEVLERLHGEGSTDAMTEDSPEVVAFNAACNSLNDEIRRLGQNPWDVLTDADSLHRMISPHLERQSMQAQIAELQEALNVQKNEQSKSEAARTAGASSPPGRSTRTTAEHPDTSEGRAAKTLAELEGRIPRDF